MDQHYIDPEALHQRYIVNNAVKIGVQNSFTTDCDNKGFTPVRMNIRRGFTEKLYVVLSSHQRIISNSGQ